MVSILSTPTPPSPIEGGGRGNSLLKRISKRFNVSSTDFSLFRFFGSSFLKHIIAEPHIDLVIRIGDLDLAGDPLGLLPELGKFLYPTWFFRGHVELEVNTGRKIETAESSIVERRFDFPPLGREDLYLSDQAAVRVYGQYKTLVEGIRIYRNEFQPDCFSTVIDQAFYHPDVEIFFFEQRRVEVPTLLRKEEDPLGLYFHFVGGLVVKLGLQVWRLERFNVEMHVHVNGVILQAGVSFFYRIEIARRVFLGLNSPGRKEKEKPRP